MLENATINIKFKLAALWLTIFLLFVYGDLLPMWIPPHLDDLLNGEVGSGPATRLLGIAVYVTVYALMPLMNLILSARVSRILNIVASVLLIAFWIYILAVFSFDRMWAFYIYFAAVEMILALVIIYASWTWPTPDGSSASGTSQGGADLTGIRPE